MTTKQFIQLLDQHPNQPLLFEYLPGEVIEAGFHITEVKNLLIESVDCGGIDSTERQTVVQLMDGTAKEGEMQMSTNKAKKIFDLVGSKRPMTPNAEIGFEYGGEKHPTSVFRISNVTPEDHGLRIQLHVPGPVCKPSAAIQVGLKKLKAVGSCC